MVTAAGLVWNDTLVAVVNAVGLPNWSCIIAVTAPEAMPAVDDKGADTNFNWCTAAALTLRM